MNCEAIARARVCVCFWWAITPALLNAKTRIQYTRNGPFAGYWIDNCISRAFSPRIKVETLQPMDQTRGTQATPTVHSF